MHPELHLGSLSIPTYFLIISIDFCLMFWYLSVRSQKWNISSKMALDVGLVATVFGFISARLFHVFYEVPEYYLDHPAAILYLWEGGYVFFAGLLGGLAAGLIWLYWRKQKIFIWLDLFAPILALGYYFLRWLSFSAGSE